jgi:hypothetical protein
MSAFTFTHDGHTVPMLVTHNGKHFYATGKGGKVIKTGVQSAEYESVDKDGRRTGERIWVDANGCVYED